MNPVPEWLRDPTTTRPASTAVQRCPPPDARPGPDALPAGDHRRTFSNTDERAAYAATFPVHVGVECGKTFHKLVARGGAPRSASRHRRRRGLPRDATRRRGGPRYGDSKYDRSTTEVPVPSVGGGAPTVIRVEAPGRARGPDDLRLTVV